MRSERSQFTSHLMNLTRGRSLAPSSTNILHQTLFFLFRVIHCNSTRSFPDIIFTSLKRKQNKQKKGEGWYVDNLAAARPSFTTTRTACRDECEGLARAGVSKRVTTAVFYFGGTCETSEGVNVTIGRSTVDTHLEHSGDRAKLKTIRCEHSWLKFPPFKARRWGQMTRLRYWNKYIYKEPRKLMCDSTDKW